MAGTPRIIITNEPTAYHVMSRTALEGYPLDDVDNDFYVSQTLKFSKLYFKAYLRHLVAHLPTLALQYRSLSYTSLSDLRYFSAVSRASHPIRQTA